LTGYLIPNKKEVRIHQNITSIITSNIYIYTNLLP
jgi:hypothetical protein